MKKTIYFVVVGFLMFFASQVLANELLVLSKEKSQNSQKWKDEVFPEYPESEVGETLPARIIDIQGDHSPKWLVEAWEEGRVGRIYGVPTFIIWDPENKKEVGRVEGYTQKPRFYAQLNEAVVMVSQGGHPGLREGSGGETRQEGSGGMSGNIMDHVYKTPDEAKRASEMLGLGGKIHSHETPEGPIFMPGETM